jgi:hypothetical protein
MATLQSFHRFINTISSKPWITGYPTEELILEQRFHSLQHDPLNSLDEKEKAVAGSILNSLFYQPLAETEILVKKLDREMTLPVAAIVVKALRILPFIARFPKEVGAKMYSEGDYFQNQFKFGEMNKEAVQKSRAELPLEAKFREWAQQRRDYERYNWWAIHRVELYYNLWVGRDFNAFRADSQFFDGALTRIAGRYAFTLEYQPQARAHLSVREEDNGYRILYPDPRKAGELLPLTHVAPGTWYHTYQSIIRICLPHLESLHEELASFGEEMKEAEGTPSYEEKKEKFLNHLSHIYWLTVHLMLTGRGNSQYCLNLLFQQLTKYGLEPLVPKPGVLVDCIALTLPLELFQKSFLDHFEPAGQVAKIDRALQPIIARSCRWNPDLLSMIPRKLVRFLFQS